MHQIIISSRRPSCSCCEESRKFTRQGNQGPNMNDQKFPTNSHIKEFSRPKSSAIGHRRHLPSIHQTISYLCCAALVLFASLATANSDSNTNDNATDVKSPIRPTVPDPFKSKDFLIGSGRKVGVRIADAPDFLLRLAKIRSAAGLVAKDNKDDKDMALKRDRQPLLGRQSEGTMQGLQLVDVDFPDILGDNKLPSDVSGGSSAPMSGDAATAGDFRFSGSSSSSVPARGAVNADGSVRRRNDKTLSFPMKVVSGAPPESFGRSSGDKGVRDLRTSSRKSLTSRHIQSSTFIGSSDRTGVKHVTHNYAVPPQAASYNQVNQVELPEEQLYLPECASQQVCAAVHVRFNSSTPLCSCPVRFGERCSTSLTADDGHSMSLVSDPLSKPLTLVKTCEPNRVIESCHNQKDWSLFALQNTRTRKAHYLIICSCPLGRFMEGPIEHAAPEYAQVPGIRIFGMMCVTTPLRKGKHKQPELADDPPSVNQPSPDLWRRIADFLEHLDPMR